MKKSWLLIFSGILLLIGFALLIGSLPITGNVISEKVGKTLSSIVGLIFIIGGIVLLEVTTRNYQVGSLEEKLADDSYVLFDSSGFIDYENQIDSFLGKYKGNVFIPDKAAEELKGDVKKMHGNKLNIISSKDYNDYVKIAKEKIEQTPKHQDYLKAVKLLEEGEKGFTRDEISNLRRKLLKVGGYIREDNPSLSENPIAYKKAMEKYIEKRWKASEGDFSVLASALYFANQDKKIDVVAHDTHIRDAIEIMKNENIEEARNINYINYRRYEKAA